MEGYMKPIYKNFDGLEVSFQGALPERILKQLREAKEEAVKDRNDAAAILGDSVKVMVAETGLRGGYAFRFDTGLDRETWFVADSTNRSRWNIRVSVKSLALALHGYVGVKQKILELLETLGAKGEDNDLPLERVSRFDYCIDFKTTSFELDYKSVVAHSKSKREFSGEDNINSISFVSVGKNLSSARVGVMPNQQLAIYNKTKEIVARSKPYWWKIWGIEKEGFEGQIWRVEVRSGKKELNHWNLRRWNDFERMAGDVASSILNNIRYVTPNPNDSNQSRWPDAEFWIVAKKEIKEDLFQYSCNAKRQEIISDLRKNVDICYKKLISGIITSYTAVAGMDIAELPAVMELIYEELLNDSKQNPEKILKKFQKAEKKFQFLYDI